MMFSKTVVAGLFFLLLCAPQSHAQTAVVYWNNTDQVIDGFGASTAFEGGLLTPTQAVFFFSPSSGIGLSLLRTMVPHDGSCATVNATCAGEVSDMQLAIANGARVWSSPWSPPASMKSNDSVDNGGSLLPGSYGSYATYLSNYIKSLSSLYGINLYALSIQNEPNQPHAYPTAVWTAQNFHDFILNNLGPTLAANGQSRVRIMLPESSHWSLFAEDSSITMADPAALAYVGITAWHDYDDAPSVSNPYGSAGKGSWETEASGGYGYGPSLCGGCWDPSMADALLWAQIVDNRMAVANANSWNWWLVFDDHNTDNSGLIGPDGVTVAKHTYVLGNYSKFVRPGSYRIEATHEPQSGVLVSAYRNLTSGALVIVVINQNTSNIPQSFILNGTTVSSVTPWLTSAIFDLAQQSEVSVRGGTFAYTLPASSVTSFVGNVSTASGSRAAPAPPTRLAARVQ
jgi:glucuronoarabinoxylan endo-1,4-beta-xylanase